MPLDARAPTANGRGGERVSWPQVVALFALALTGCAVGQLQFRNDDRLTFISPEARARVELPLAIRWSMQDFDPVGLDGSRNTRQGAFVVFVDRAPMPAGKGLRWLGKDDRACERDPTCPDASYLAERDVYVVTDGLLELDTLPVQREGFGDEQHYVNVVLVDGTGQRIGESAWYRPFEIMRRSPR